MPPVIDPILKFFFVLSYLFKTACEGSTCTIIPALTIFIASLIYILSKKEEAHISGRISKLLKTLVSTAGTVFGRAILG